MTRQVLLLALLLVGLSVGQNASLGGEQRESDQSNSSLANGQRRRRLGSRNILFSTISDKDYTENDPAVIVFDNTDSLKFCANGETSTTCLGLNDEVTSAYVEISNVQSGDSLACGSGQVTGGSIPVVWNPLVHRCIFDVSSSPTPEQLNEAFHLVKFRSTSEAAGFSHMRQVQFVVNNVGHHECSVFMYNANDEPRFSGIPPTVVYPVATAPITFVNNGIYQISIIDDDADKQDNFVMLDGFEQEVASPGIGGAFVEITMGWENRDKLEIDTALLTRGPPEYETSSEIHASFSAQKINLYGNAPKAHYEAVLRSVSFATSTTDTEQERAIRFHVNDTFAGSPLDYTVETKVVLLTRPVGFEVITTKNFSSELGERATIEVKPTHKPQAPILCAVTSSDAKEATATPPFVVITVANWETPIKVSLVGQADGEYDGDKHYYGVVSVMMSQDLDYNKLYRTPSHVELTNIDDPANLLRIYGQTATVDSCTSSEDGAVGEFQVSVANWHSGFLPFHSVRVTAVSSTPTEGVIEGSETVTFTQQDWETPKTLSVKGTDDDVQDGTIDYKILLSAELFKYDENDNLVPTPQIIFPQQISQGVTCYNEDNDNAELTITGTCLVTTEGGDRCTFTIRLRSQPLHKVQLSTFSMNPTEGSIEEGSLIEFEPSNWDTPQYVVVQGVDDFESDGDQLYSVRFGPSTSQDPLYVGFSRMIEMTNKDNDLSQLKIENKEGQPLSGSDLRVDETGSQDTFMLFIPSKPAQNVYMELKVDLDSEAIVSPTIVTFTPTDYNIKRTITVTGVDDDVVDGDSRFVVSLKFTSADNFFDGVTWSMALKNYDDDGLTLTHNNVLVNEGGSQVQVGFSLPRWVDGTTGNTRFEQVNTTITSDDTTEFTVSPTELTFDSTNWNIPQNVTFTGVDDHIADGTIASTASIQMGLTYARVDTGATTQKAIKSFQLPVQTEDDDTASILVQVVSGEFDPVDTHVQLTDELGTKNASFSVEFSSRPLAQVIVPIMTTDDSEGLPDPVELTFTVDNWMEPQLVHVLGQQDDLDDGDISYKMKIGPCTTTDPFYGPISHELSYKNLDEDLLGISTSIISNGNEITNKTSEWGNKARFKVVLHTQPTAPVLFSVSSMNMVEGIANPSLIVLAADNWATGAYVDVQGQFDGQDDGNSQYQIQVASMISQDAAYLAHPPVFVDFLNIDEPYNRIFLTAAPSTCQTTEAGGVDTFRVSANLWHEGEQAFEKVIITAKTENPLEGLLLNKYGDPETEVAVEITKDFWKIGTPITVQGVDDSIVDGTKYNDHTKFNITYTAQIKIVGINTLKTIPIYKTSQFVECTNLDDDIPHLSFMASDPTCQVSEDGSTCRIKMVFTSAPEADLYIPVTIDDASEAKVQGAGANGVFLLHVDRNSWDNPPEVVIVGVDDDIADELQTFNVQIGPTQSTDSDYAGKSFVINMANLDNDVARLVVMQGNVDLENGQSAAVDETRFTQPFTVQLPDEPSAPVVVVFTSSDPGEGIVVDADGNEVKEYTFTKDNFDVAQQVFIEGVDDNEVDGTQSFTISLTTKSGDERYSNLLLNFDVENEDDDLLLFTADSCQTSEELDSCVLAAYVDDLPDKFEYMDLTFTSTNMNEGRVFPEIAKRINQANKADAIDVQTQGQDDFVDDGDVTYYIEVNTQLKFKHHGGSGGIKSIKTFSIPVLNIDNDNAGLNVHQQFQTRYEVDSEGVNQTVTEVVPILCNENGQWKNWYEVVLNSEPISEVTVKIGNTDPGEVTAGEDVKALIFTSDNWNERQRVEIWGVDDDVQDGNQTYQLVIGPTSSDDKNYVGLVQYLNGMTTDDDKIGLVVTVSQNDDGSFMNITREDGTKAGQLKVRLSSEPKETVLFTVSTSKPQEASASPSIVAFSPDNWDMDQWVSVIGEDDPFLDGDQQYDLIVNTLFTEDLDYAAGQLRASKSFINMDDPFDRDASECQLGYYGENPDCTKCPIGRFMTTTRDSKTEDSCKFCFPGTYSPNEGNAYGAKDMVAGVKHPCLPCDAGFHAPAQGSSKCDECANDGKTWCPFASMKVLARNESSVSTEIIHTWNTLEEKVYQELWTFGTLAVVINESSLQLILLLLSFFIMILACILAQCIHCCSAAELIDPKAWPKTKNAIISLDGFADAHARYIKDANNNEDSNTLIGGFSTILFAAMSWALCGVVFFLFIQYNESILQSLVPRIAADEIKADIIADLEFVGYTGYCPPKSVIESFGVIGRAYREVDCGEGYLKVKWQCEQCMVSSPVLTVDLSDATNQQNDGGQNAGDYVMSTAAINWRLESSPVIPGEVNAVYGAVKAVPDTTGASRLLRGEKPTVVQVTLIPARFSNTITKIDLNGFRVQYDSATAGAMVDKERYLHSSVANKVRVRMNLLTSAVQLDTMVAPKQTFLDVWSTAGGLFASIGATVVTGMNIFEILIKCTGCSSVKKKNNKNKKKKKKKKAGGKGKGKKGKKGKGGKGGGGDGPGPGAGTGKGKGGGGMTAANAMPAVSADKPKQLYDINGNPLSASATPGAMTPTSQFGGRSGPGSGVASNPGSGVFPLIDGQSKGGTPRSGFSTGGSGFNSTGASNANSGRSSAASSRGNSRGTSRRSSMSMKSGDASGGSGMESGEDSINSDVSELGSGSETGGESEGEAKEVLTGAARAAQRYIMQRRSLHVQKKKQMEERALAAKLASPKSLMTPLTPRSVNPSMAGTTAHSMMGSLNASRESSRANSNANTPHMIMTPDMIMTPEVMDEDQELREEVPKEEPQAAFIQLSEEEEEEEEEEQVEVQEQEEDEGNYSQEESNYDSRSEFSDGNSDGAGSFTGSVSEGYSGSEYSQSENSESDGEFITTGGVTKGATYDDYSGSETGSESEGAESDGAFVTTGSVRKGATFDDYASGSGSESYESSEYEEEEIFVTSSRVQKSAI